MSQADFFELGDAFGRRQTAQISIRKGFVTPKRAFAWTDDYGTTTTLIPDKTRCSVEADVVQRFLERFRQMEHSDTNAQWHLDSLMKSRDFKLGRSSRAGARTCTCGCYVPDPKP